MPQFRCPHCHRPGRAAAKFAGRHVQCPHCRGPFLVPPVELAEPPPASPPQPPVSVVHEREREEGGTPASGPSAIASFFWVVVFFTAVLACVGVGVAAWVAWRVPARDSAFGEYHLLVVLLTAGAALVPLYVMARAIDRLTQ